jgi:hypothetical protein
VPSESIFYLLFKVSLAVEGAYLMLISM